MKRAADFAATARRYASFRYEPPQVMLERITEQADRIRKLGRVSDLERDQALAICWDAYAKVLSRMDSSLDESWGGAKRRGTAFEAELSIVDDDALASLLMYGEADDDGRE